MKKIGYNEEGNYTIQDEEFVIREKLRSDKKDILLKGGFKNKEEVWYYFSKGELVFNKEISNSNLGNLTLSFSYSIRVTSDISEIEEPNKVRLYKDNSDLEISIKELIIRKFQSSIIKDKNYKQINEKLSVDFQPNYTAHTAAQTLKDTNEMYICLNNLKANYITKEEPFKEPFNNGLYDLTFSVINLDIQQNIEERLEKSKQDIFKLTKEDKDFKLEFLKLATEFGPQGLSVFKKIVEEDASFLPSKEQAPSLKESNNLVILDDRDIKAIDGSYHSNIEGIKAIALPKLEIYKNLSKSDKQSLFDEWIGSNVTKIKPKTTEEIIELFIKEIDSGDFIVRNKKI